VFGVSYVTETSCLCGEPKNKL